MGSRWFYFACQTWWRQQLWALPSCSQAGRDDQVCADGEPAGSDQTVQVLPASGAQQEGPAGGWRGALLLEPQERAGNGPSIPPLFGLFLLFLVVMGICGSFHRISLMNLVFSIMQICEQCGVSSNCLVFSVPLWSTKTLSWFTVSTPLCSSWSQSQRMRSVTQVTIYQGLKVIFQNCLSFVCQRSSVKI